MFSVHPSPSTASTWGSRLLASGKAEEAEKDLEAILGRVFPVLPPVLEGKIRRDGKNIHSLFALNDLVLAKGAMARVMHIEVSSATKCSTRCPRTASSFPLHGSTAYALSAGGPIVPPHIPCMIIVPICAHTLYTRPVLAGENDVITLTPKGNHRDLLLTQDGQLGTKSFPETVYSSP